VPAPDEFAKRPPLSANAFLLFGVIGLVFLATVAALSEYEGLKRERTENLGSPPPAGITGNAEAENDWAVAVRVRDSALADRQSGMAGFLFFGAAVIIVLVAVAGSVVHLKRRRYDPANPYWTGSRPAALAFGLVGGIAPGFVLLHLTLANGVDASLVPAFTVGLMGLPGVSAAVGYYVGRRPEATGLLAITTGIGLAVAVCVWVGTRDLGGFFAGRARGEVTAAGYLAATGVLWTIALAAVAAAGQIARKRRRRLNINDPASPSKRPRGTAPPAGRRRP